MRKSPAPFNFDKQVGEIIVVQSPIIFHISYQILHMKYGFNAAASGCLAERMRHIIIARAISS
jgi:hypothetical protein